MNTLSKVICLGLGLAISSVSLAEENRHVDYAKVTRVTPVYQTIKHRIPQESCWTETVRREPRRHRGHQSATSTLVGGLIGGAIGHAVGHGKDNKKIGAVVGSVIGMSVGNDIGRHHANRHNHRSHHAVYEDVERCDVNYRTETEERLTGYDVDYKFRGERYTTFTKEHPGDRMKIIVSVSPVVEF